MHKIVSLINEKGGVGKTTLTLVLADYYSRRTKKVLSKEGTISTVRNKVLVVDCDPQKSLNSWLSKNKTTFHFTAVSLTKGDDFKLGTSKDLLKVLDVAPRFDYIFMDTPGAWQSEVVIGAKEMAHLVILPTQNNDLSLDVTLLNAYELAHPTENDLTDMPKQYKILFNNIDPRSVDFVNKKKVELVKQRYNVFNTTVRRFSAIEHLNSSSLFTTVNANASKNDIINLSKEIDYHLEEVVGRKEEQTYA